MLSDNILQNLYKPTLLPLIKICFIRILSNKNDTLRVPPIAAVFKPKLDQIALENPENNITAIFTNRTEEENVGNIFCHVLLQYSIVMSRA